MSCRRVEVVVRSGEVVVVLDSIEELAEVLGEVERRRSVDGIRTPEPAAGDRRPVVAGSVAVPFEVWSATRALISEAEGMFRASRNGDWPARWDIHHWLQAVEKVRAEWM